jgi:hypothetical protein
LVGRTETVLVNWVRNLRSVAGVTRLLRAEPEHSEREREGGAANGASEC